MSVSLSQIYPTNKTCLKIGRHFQQMCYGAEQLSIQGLECALVLGHCYCIRESASPLVIIMFLIMLSGTDSIIECMHGESLPEDVVKMDCYIQVNIWIMIIGMMVVTMILTFDMSCFVSKKWQVMHNQLKIELWILNVGFERKVNVQIVKAIVADRRNIPRGDLLLEFSDFHE